MRALGVLWVVLLPAAFSQTIAPPEFGSEFFNRAGLAPLKCQVQPIHPTLDFAFRLHAGVYFRVPIYQYRGKGHTWTVGLRIQRESGGAPVYLINRLGVPEVQRTRLETVAEGEFLLGEGNYRASFQLVDDERRSCRGDWNIQAKLGPPENLLKLAVAPGAIEPIATPLAVSAPGGGHPLADRLTVFVNAAPVAPSLVGLHAGDTATILTSLISLLNQVQARSVKLVVFSLDQQKELYRNHDFTPDRLPQVQQALDSLQLGVIRYTALERPKGYLNLLADLVNEEISDAKPARLVVFLGPHSHLCGKPLADALDNPEQGSTKFFYLEYTRPVALSIQDQPSAEGWLDVSNDQPDLFISEPNAAPIVVGDPISLPANYNPTELDISHDAIDHMVSLLKGRTLVIRKPQDLAKALGQLTQ
ncbi:MAG TPA: hypothetical protein VML19_19230 [Verrucomicrobiae bacterium]|nr:hypothetical protein [Verrucomicrobiae bacterium]